MLVVITIMVVQGDNDDSSEAGYKDDADNHDKLFTDATLHNFMADAPQSIIGGSM